MKVVYIADDGTWFNNEFACEDYEWRLNHPHVKDVHIFDENGNEFEDVLADDTYHNAMKIIVPNDEALKDFQAFAEYSGYCSYGDVDQVGEWVFDERNFVMVR